MPVIPFDQNYPQDLKAMTPSAFNEPDNINEVPADPGTEGAYDPAARTRTDLWPQQIINLKDIDGNQWWQYKGKVLMIRRDGPSPEGYSVEFSLPDTLETARDFSIAGDGIAPAIPFDGSANVALQLTDVAATTLKTARGFSLSGDIAADEVMFDATGNVVLVTRYENVIPDNKLPSWISELSTKVDGLEITVSNNYVTLTNKINAVDARVTTVDNRVTTINNSTQIQISNLGSAVSSNSASISSLGSTVSSQGAAIAELQSGSSGPVGEIGSYAFLACEVNIGPGDLVTSNIGNNLTYSNGFDAGDEAVPVGQVWQCCGRAFPSSEPGTSSTLFRRVS